MGPKNPQTSTISSNASISFAEPFGGGAGPIGSRAAARATQHHRVVTQQAFGSALVQRVPPDILGEHAVPRAHAIALRAAHDQVVTAQPPDALARPRHDFPIVIGLVVEERLASADPATQIHPAVAVGGAVEVPRFRNVFSKAASHDSNLRS